MSATPETMAPGVEKLLKTLGVEGWQALDPDSEPNKQARAEKALERYSRAKLVADAFTGEKGRAALDFIRSQTTLAETWPSVGMGHDNAVAMGFFREGQNALVRWIELQIRIAEQGPGGDITPRKSGRSKP